MTNLLSILILLSAFTAKADFTVLIIDTGLSSERTELTKYVPKTYKHDYEDLHEQGHGTHVTSLILKHACPGVKIIPCRFWKKPGDGKTLKRELNCLKMGLKLKVDLVNMSLNGTDYEKMEEKLLKIYEIKKIPVIVALGNENEYLKLEKEEDDLGSYPADLKLNNITRVGGLKGSKFYEFTNLASNAIYLESGYWAASKKPDSKTYMAGTSQATAFYTGQKVKEYCENSKKVLDFFSKIVDN